MAVDVPGLVSVIVFYVCILAIGVWGSRKSKKVEKKCSGSKSEVAIIGGRNINILVGIFTMTATWVGGGYIMGTAESVYSPTQGLVWALGPPAYVLCFFVAGLFFAKPMRSKRYVTMLDPFQNRYGKAFTVTLLLPALWLCVPFMVLSPAVTVISQTLPLNQTSEHAWMGHLDLEVAGKWVDEMLLMALGGLSYQALYQRILSAASSVQAQISCFAAALTVFIMGIPSVVIGVMASAADWNQTAYGLPPPFERGDAGKILPLALQHLTPTWVSVLGIGSVAAAVMSSMDSALLSSASMFTQNIYKTTLRKTASERELQWVIRIGVLVVGLAGTGLAFGDDSVFALWVLSGDLLYCVIFPQLLCVLHFQRANTYGAFSGFVVGLLLRGLSGEPILGIPPVLLYPGWREENNVIRQYFPYRTIAMLFSVVSILAVSCLLNLIFEHELIPQSWDFLQVFKNKNDTEEDEAPGSFEEINQVLHTKF
ncbi:high-affinity choline transporter 1-like isoform X3 [Xiphophorus maculatus]|uniref:high-affinity choline transporter 1-like isoform X3 n=1 Tax=Xiphophorus maculatus TaxID=8083 RepID=UPI000C6CA78E|nr:high-affinity choline transporter 1-like isoform X3 [Xiphophorus maculatus]